MNQSYEDKSLYLKVIIKSVNFTSIPELKVYHYPPARITNLSEGNYILFTMTIDDNDIGGSFTGAMKDINLEDTEYSRTTLQNMPYNQLALAKSDIERTLESLFDLLTYKYKFDMHLPLVINGFPRSDVDVVTIRLIRIKIIRLRNDHAFVLQLLEAHLVERLQGSNPTDEAVTTTIEVVPSQNYFPFAVVREVAPNGPADKSGLRTGDTVTLFDSDIHAGNHNKLSALAGRVREKVGRDIPVELIREGQKVQVTLVPTDNWGGRGVLGCLLVPL